MTWLHSAANAGSPTKDDTHPTTCQPVHASWLNQVEIYFSILQRKAITPGDFADLDALAARILAFQNRYNTTAEPFDWRDTRDDLDAHLNRLTAA